MVESVDDRARARSTLGGVTALAVTALAGWWLIPAGGATGAVLALVAGLAVRGPLLPRVRPASGPAAEEMPNPQLSPGAEAGRPDDPQRRAGDQRRPVP
ncbi:hypothetical protein AB0M46_47000 [Dactylosporangium sp. NPDC051485]|uniref:hypothetical protein n=1 Tax=Dactylosporangium sp. NPDC051485 TaxID=3154846 RepID=UPI003435C575